MESLVPRTVVEKLQWPIAWLPVMPNTAESFADESPHSRPAAAVVPTVPQGAVMWIE